MEGMYKAPYEYQRTPLVQLESAFHEDWTERIEGRSRLSERKARDYMSVKKVLTFDADAPDWVVVHGCSGIGKTALVRWIASQWARGSLWSHLTLVLTVEFSKLDAENYSDPFRLYNFDGLEDLVWENRERVLFVVDDYELVAHMDNQSDSWVRSVLSRIREFPRWIFVSRTDCIQPLIERKMVRNYRLGLMNPNQRSHYISNVFRQWEERCHQPDTKRLMFSFPPNIQTEVELHDKLAHDEELFQMSYIPLLSKMICKAFTNGVKTSTNVRIFILARLLRRYLRKYHRKLVVVRSMDEANFLLQSDLVQRLIMKFLSPSNPQRQDLGPCIRGLLAASSSSTSVSSVLSASSSSSTKSKRKHGDKSLHEMLNTGIFTAWIANRDRQGKIIFNYRAVHSVFTDILSSILGLTDDDSDR